MIADRLRLIHRSQRGITLVELMIVIALAGIVTAGITMTFAHVFSGSTRTSNHMTAVRQVQSAGYWVSRDALQAQDVDTVSEFVKLTWIDFDETKTEFTYTITADSKLRRSVKITPDGEGTTETVSFVAQYIDPDETSCIWDGGMLAFTVTATVGGQSETRVYDVTPRPGQ